MEAGGARGMRFTTYKRFVPAHWKIGYRYACWARNHGGWAKMKKGYRKLAKKRLKRELERDARQ